MGRVSNAVRFTFRWVPWVITGASLAYRRLPDKSQNEIREVAKEPRKWGEGLEKAWDASRIGADHFQKTSGTLANILIGRRVSRKERIQARDDLAALRVFMIPGSQILLGIMARVTPWRLVPDAWIPLNALKKIREEETPSLDQESAQVRRMLGR